MKHYSKEFKDAILRRMIPPNNESISEIASEEGLADMKETLCLKGIEITKRY